MKTYYLVIFNTLTCLILSSLLSSLVAMACTMASYVDLLPALPESPVREPAMCSGEDVVLCVVLPAMDALSNDPCVFIPWRHKERKLRRNNSVYFVISRYHNMQKPRVCLFFSNTSYQTQSIKTVKISC